MYCKTGFLAIALGVATVASAAVPASALPNKNIPAQFHPVMQPVNRRSRRSCRRWCNCNRRSRRSFSCRRRRCKLPPVVQLPHPIDNICPLNKFKCPPGPIPSPKPPGGGPIVIVTPPVEVPVVVPVGIPQRIGGGGGVAYAAPARPQAAAQCSAAATTPELAAGIDQLLPTAPALRRRQGPGERYAADDRSARGERQDCSGP